MDAMGNGRAFNNNTIDLSANNPANMKHPLHQANSQFVGGGANTTSIGAAIDIDSIVNGRNAPIKAFPTPSNAVGNILNMNESAEKEIHDQDKNRGKPNPKQENAEAEMLKFVQNFEKATLSGKAHD